MSVLYRIPRRRCLIFGATRHFCVAQQQSSLNDTKTSTDASILEDEGFERMSFVPRARYQQRFSRNEMYRAVTSKPRYTLMSTDQDWNSVWPAAKSFNPSSVPLPIYLGYLKGKPRFGKFNNHELLKIQNFLHLTPTNVKKQCQALKKFCNPWPKGLETEEQIEKHFPLEIITKDYCHAAPTIRNPKARIVSIKFKLSALELDEHAKDKMIRLLDNRYDLKTDIVTITAQACPLKQQNLDYALYQLTACYYESWKFESWEEGKEPQDWERFFWDKSSSKRKALELLDQFYPEAKEKKVETKKMALLEYEKALTNLMDKGDSEKAYDAYGESVSKLLFN